MKKVVHHTEVNEDKKLKSTIKKFGMQSLQDIDEVNMFKDDNTVIHLKRPQSKFQKALFNQLLYLTCLICLYSSILSQRKPFGGCRYSRDQRA